MKSIAMISLTTTMWLLLTFCSGMSGDDQLTRNAAQAKLDVALHEYAFDAFVKPKTGVAYEGVVPRNITGVRVSCMRLKSGSLMTRGVERYQEFEIPKGVVTHPYVERLALVYQNLTNWSIAYYPPPLQGYTYLAPVIGLLAYDASHLEPEARNSTNLYIHASADPISIHFPRLVLPEHATVRPKCVFFDINGSVSLTNISSSDNVCTTFVQGHFSVVVESSAVASDATTSGGGSGNTGKIVGGVFGGLALMVALGVGVVGASKYKHRKKMQSMEMVSEFSEALYITKVGSTKAPSAIGTRTLPKLETEYLP